jgi:hypothetical protein
MKMTNEELEAKLESLQRQCDKLFSLHGLPKWPVQEKQRRDNAKAQGTRLPFTTAQEHGGTYRPKPHEGQ